MNLSCVSRLHHYDVDHALSFLAYLLYGSNEISRRPIDWVHRIGVAN